MVNYKTLEVTQLCLELLQKNLDLNQVDVWVVDNNSQDESTQYLRSLDWIRLLERTPQEHENGFTSHGNGLDFAVDKISTDYVLLMHTDTLLHNPQIITRMLDMCTSHPKVIAVGCYEQVYRGAIKTCWRITTRFIKHIFRLAKIKIGINTRTARGYREIYIKSFCAMWNLKTIKSLGCTFFMGNRIPTYELQDYARGMGYTILDIPPADLFQYLDHIEAGTVSVKSNYGKSHRRVKRKKFILSKMNDGK